MKNIFCLSSILVLISCASKKQVHHYHDEINKKTCHDSLCTQITRTPDVVKLTITKEDGSKPDDTALKVEAFCEKPRFDKVKKDYKNQRKMTYEIHLGHHDNEWEFLTSDLEEECLLEMSLEYQGQTHFIEYNISGSPNK
ncbi:MAG: hypothetical protein ACOYL6_16705 [Bacteriovoracaceae bacterium]